MNLILHSIKAVSLAGLAEGMALADRAGLSQKDLIDILGMTSLQCPMLIEKGKGTCQGLFMFYFVTCFFNNSFICFL